MLILIANIASAQTTATATQQVGGGGVGALIGAYACRNVLNFNGGGVAGAITSAIGNTASYAICVGSVATLVGLFTPIFLIILLIILFEALVRFDIVGDMRRLLSIFKGFASKGISLLPSEPSASSNAYLFKLQAPLYTLINVNRAVLYIGLFLVLATTVPFSLMFNLSGSVMGLLYEATYTLIVVFEPLVLSVIMVFILIDMMLDIFYIIVGATH